MTTKKRGSRWFRLGRVRKTALRTGTLLASSKTALVPCTRFNVVPDITRWLGVEKPRYEKIILLVKSVPFLIVWQLGLKNMISNGGIAFGTTG
jgi:hypothetical protein